MDVAVRRPDEGREQERKLWEPSQYSLLRAIPASNLNILDRNLLRPELIRGSLASRFDGILAMAGYDTRFF
jgi:hypothetical protein